MKTTLNGFFQLKQDTRRKECQTDSRSTLNRPTLADDTVAPDLTSRCLSNEVIGQRMRRSGLLASLRSEQRRYVRGSWPHHVYMTHVPLVSSCFHSSLIAALGTARTAANGCSAQCVLAARIEKLITCYIYYYVAYLLPNHRRPSSMLLVR